MTNNHLKLHNKFVIYCFWIAINN